MRWEPVDFCSLQSLGTDQLKYRGGSEVVVTVTTWFERVAGFFCIVFFSSRRRHTRLQGDWSSDVCSSDLMENGELFAVCYADLDHFKEYNDRYSYNDGDRVIYILSRILHDVVKGMLGNRGFVGHIGGDDFIFIVPFDAIPDVCGEVLEVFDTLIPYQYNEQDRRAGYYFGKDRRGQLHRVPLMTLSIGIVTNQHRRFAHPAQVSELATEMKSYAKTQPGSVFVVDRRHDPELSEGDPR